MQDKEYTYYYLPYIFTEDIVYTHSFFGVSKKNVTLSYSIG